MKLIHRDIHDQIDNFTFLLVDRVYGQVRKRPISKKSYKDDAISVQLASVAHLAEEILLRNKTNPYNNVDEVMGDLQLVLTESFNRLQESNNGHIRATLEGVMENFNNDN